MVAFLISVEVERHPTPTLEEMVGMAMYGLTWHVQLSVIPVEVKKKLFNKSLVAFSLDKT